MTSGTSGLENVFLDSADQRITEFILLVKDLTTFGHKDQTVLSCAADPALLRNIMLLSHTQVVYLRARITTFTLHKLPCT